MSSAELLVDSFNRIQEVVRGAVEGLTDEQLTYRADEDANSIAWLVWHLTRVQDDHIAEAAGVEQVWTAAGWEKRFNLPLDRLATGYAHGSTEVNLVKASAAELLEYHDAVHSQTIAYLRTLTDDDLTRVVDTSWDPPVTLSVRLISVISDDLQHAGQAAFVRGLLDRAQG